MAMSNVSLTALAFAVPFGVYMALRPWRLPRGAQVRSALVMLAAAVVFGAAINADSSAGSRVLDLVCGVVIVASGFHLLVKERRR